MEGHEREYHTLQSAIFNASLTSSNVSFDTKLQHAMRADDYDKAKQVIVNAFNKYGSTQVRSYA